MVQVTEPWKGTDCDMRTVVSAIPREVKDGFKYDEIPWQRFPHFYGPGEEVPVLLATLGSGDAKAAVDAGARPGIQIHGDRTEPRKAPWWRRLFR